MAPQAGVGEGGVELAPYCSTRAVNRFRNPPLPRSLRFLAYQLLYWAGKRSENLTAHSSRHLPKCGITIV